MIDVAIVKPAKPEHRHSGASGHGATRCGYIADSRHAEKFAAADLQPDSPGEHGGIPA